MDPRRYDRETSRWRRLSGALTLAALVFAGACGDVAPEAEGESWPAADVLFQRGPRFLGADGAYSVPLDDERILWLFGDTGIARTAGQRADGFFLRNTIAVQHGVAPEEALIRHYWAWDGTEARSYFAEPSDYEWLWPMHGLRIADTLVLFFEVLRQEGEPGPWSFALNGSAAVIIDNPADEPEDWRQRLVAVAPSLGGSAIGEAVVRDGDSVYVYGTRGDRHDIFVVRYSLADFTAGRLDSPERYCGDRFALDCSPAEVIAHGAPEFSIHYEPRLDSYVYVAGAGFGSTSIVWRTAPRPEGPWSEPTDVFRPPESHFEGAFVYAAKAHPEIPVAGGLAVTYVPSSFDDIPEAFGEHYYHPHFVRVFFE